MKKKTKKRLKIYGIAALLVLLIVIVMSNIRGEKREEDSVPEDVQKRAREINRVVSKKIQEAMHQLNPKNIYDNYIASEFTEVDVSSVSDRSMGASSPKHKMVAFMDFACGICRGASKELRSRVEENKDRLQLTYVLFPLDRKCNPGLGGKLSDYSCFSAELALCAEKDGKLFEAMEYLYSNRPSGSFDEKAFIANMSRELGLQGLSSCVDSEWLKERMKKENTIYAGISIPGTPFILLDGRRLSRVYRQADAFSSFLDYKESKE